MTDATHDEHLRSWVESADRHAEFPVQNLPFGIFAPAGGRPRGGIAIGDSILDVGGLASGSFVGMGATPKLNSLTLSAFNFALSSAMSDWLMPSPDLTSLSGLSFWPGYISIYFRPSS